MKPGSWKEDPLTLFRGEMLSAAQHLEQAFEHLKAAGEVSPHDQVEIKKMISLTRNFAGRLYTAARIRRNMLK
jgi:hypothetical protein